MFMGGDELEWVGLASLQTTTTSVQLPAAVTAAAAACCCCCSATPQVTCCCCRRRCCCCRCCCPRGSFVVARLPNIYHDRVVVVHFMPHLLCHHCRSRAHLLRQLFLYHRPHRCLLRYYRRLQPSQACWVSVAERYVRPVRVLVA